jgi:hypothetical protein
VFWVDATWTGSDYKMGSSNNLLSSLDNTKTNFGLLKDFYTVRSDNKYECLKAFYNAAVFRFKLWPAACTTVLKYFCYQYNGVTETLIV